MFRLNREKIAAILALLLLALGVYTLVTTQVVSYQEIQIKLDPADQQVPPIEPRLHLETLGGTRNPFHMSSDWEPLVPEPLALPPLETTQEVRVIFGWPAERVSGSPIHYRATSIRELDEEGQEVRPTSAAPPVTPRSSPGASATTGGGVNTSLAVEIDRPLLCERTLRLAGTVMVDVAGVPVELPIAVRDELVFIDTIEESTTSGVKSSRAFLKAFTEINGEVADPPFNGVRVEYHQVGDNVDVRLPDSVMPQGLVDAMLRGYRSVGLWLDLPASAAVGGSYDVDLGTLAPVLLSHETVPGEARATLSLESFDPATGVAAFAGEAKLQGTVDVQGIAATETIQGKCVVRTRPSEGRILSLTIDGAASFGGAGIQPGGPKVSGGGKYTVDLSTEIGSDVVRARVRRPQVRQKKVALPALGLELELASSWAQLPPGEVTGFVQTSGRTMGAVVELQLVAGDTSNPTKFLDEVGAQIRKTHPDVRTQNVMSPIGKGRSFVFSQEEEGAAPLRVQSEIYPFGQQYLIFKLKADPTPSAFGAAVQDFLGVRRSLKPLNRST